MSDETEREPLENVFHVAYQEDGYCEVAEEADDARQLLEDNQGGIEIRGFTLKIKITPWAPKQVEVTVPESQEGKVEVSIK